MKNLKRIAKVAAPLRQQVVDSLRKAIATGAYSPGQRLIELDLCERLGVSRPLVREAMRQLEAERLVDIVPNRGPVVRRLDLAEVRAVYDVRSALEATAARLMATRGTPRQMQVLADALIAVEKAYASSDVERMLESKKRFYGALFEGADNCVIPELLTNLAARVIMLRRLSLSTRERRTASIVELKALVDAVLRRDPEAAALMAGRHVSEAASVALAVVAAAEAGHPSP